MASVVSIRPLIDAAFCSAVRVTLVGSMTPAFTRSSSRRPFRRCSRSWCPSSHGSCPDHHCALFAGVHDDHAQRLFDGATDDVGTDLLVTLKRLHQLVNRRRATDQRNAAARDDAFLDCRACRMHGILDASLLFLHLGLGRRAHLDHRNTADQLGQALLQLLTVIVAGGLLHLRADLLHTAFDLAILTAAVDDRWCCPCRS